MSAGFEVVTTVDEMIREDRLRKESESSRNNNKKKDKYPKYTISINSLEKRMVYAISQRKNFRDTVYSDDLWLATVGFSYNPVGVHFTVQTSSSKVLSKTNGAKILACEFYIIPRVNKKSTEYTEGMNKLLNEANMVLIPYTPIFPLKQDVLKKCIEVALLLEKSIKINQSTKDAHVTRRVHGLIMKGE